MRPDEFLRALHLRPTPLHDRALALNAYVKPRRCETCQAIGDAARVALTAAHHEELESAAQLIDTAEQLATRHHIACQPAHEPSRGKVRRWADMPAPLIVATDASWKGRADGIGTSPATAATACAADVLVASTPPATRGCWSANCGPSSSCSPPTKRRRPE